MSIHQQEATKSWGDYFLTHNPFYVISAALTLYGLHISFGENIDPTQGWLQLQIFMGYILLLAATGVLVVRLGKVWEDARTLFLLVLLLLVALSVSFDRVCLDNEYLGLQFLSIGFGFGLLLCESLLRLLKIRLPWTYRGVLYLQLALLFFYPPWLGHLSLIDHLDTLAWYTMGFPTLIAVTVVLLVPAARRRAYGLRNNGTPWRWPWYPWTIFVVLGIGIAIRILTLTFSFDPTKGGFTSGFQAYFLIPLLLSIILVVAEHCLGRNQQRLWKRLVVLPLGLLVLAFPGTPESLAQARYLNVLQNTLGSPIQITAILLLTFFIYLFSRRHKTAEWGILASLGVLSIVDHTTLDLQSLAPVKPLPALTVIFLLVSIAIFQRSTVRLCLAILGIMLALSYALSESVFVSNRGYVPIHLTLILLVLAGLFYDDWLGRFLRRYATLFLAVVATGSLIAYRHLFPALVIPWHGLTMICLAMVAGIYWKWNQQFRDLVSFVLCLLIAVGHLLEHYLQTTLDLVALQGKKWIAWGVLSFLVGLLVSFIKGGQFGQLYRKLQQWSRPAQHPPSDS